MRVHNNAATVSNSPRRPKKNKKGELDMTSVFQLASTVS